MNSPDKSPINLWDKWLKATGVNGGCGYRVPEEVWNAAWNGNWPDDHETIRWIIEQYLDLETAEAHGYVDLVLPLRETALAALHAAQREAAEHQRQIKIDADIDEVIKTIQGLGREFDEKPNGAEKCADKLSRRRNRWLRSTITTTITAVIAALAGFVGGYNVRALNSDSTVAPSPEIRRAIPVEIRRAIPVEPAIRKAIPVQPDCK